MPTSSSGPLVRAATVACLLIRKTGAAAQEGPGFHFFFGWQDTAGDLGDVLDPGVEGFDS